MGCGHPVEGLDRSEIQTEGEVGLVENVGIFGNHIVLCHTIGAVSALKEEDRLLDAGGKSRISIDNDLSDF